MLLAVNRLFGQAQIIPSQLLQGLTAESYTWPNPEPATLEKTLAFLQQRPELLMCAEELGDAFYARFHWLDVNQDGQDDLIFNGACMPYEEIHIYLGSPDGYQKLLGQLGRLVAFEWEGEQNRLILRNDACCCNYWTKVSIWEGAAGTPIQEVSALSVHAAVFSPAFPGPDSTARKLLEKPVLSDLMGTDLILRTTPVIDDVAKEDPCTGEALPGNVIGIWEDRGSGFWVENPGVSGRMALMKLENNRSEYILGYLP